MRTENDVLEAQIGNLGGYEEPIQEHAEHAQNPSSEPENGLGRAKHFGAKKERDAKSSASMVRTGWIEVGREEFETRGSFYPQDWRFYVKPATVNDIKNFSSIDEERVEQAQEVLNEMLKNNFKITSDQGNVPTLKLNSWDRLFVLLKIREYTFVKGESAIAFDNLCEACGDNVKFELTSSNLVFETPDLDLMNEYFDAENRVWTVDPREFDVAGPVLKFYLPTVEKEAAVLKWTMNEARESMKRTGNKTPKINETLTKFLPWLLPRITRDDKINDKFIRDAESTYVSWGLELFGLANEILDKIAVTQEDKLRAICPSCGEEVYAPIQFRNGVRDLFAVQSGRKKFGEK